MTLFAALRLLGLGARPGHPGRRGRPGPDAARRARPRARRRRRPDHRVRPGRQREHRRLRPLRRASPTWPVEHRAWLHVDGAFGLWAAAAPGRRHLVAGRRARRLAGPTDAHKWLNVPLRLRLRASSRDPRRAPARDDHQGRLPPAMPATSTGMAGDWVPDSSRRARGFDTWARPADAGPRRASRDLVERCCRLARRMAERLAAEPGVEILNDVVLNQVLVRFPRATMRRPGDARTTPWSPPSRPTARAGSAAPAGTARRPCGSRSRTGRRREADIDRSAEAIIRCARAVAAAAEA